MSREGVYDARACGLVGDGVTNDQPAFAELVDRAGDGVAADGRPRVIRVPPGVYAIHAGTRWRSGVSLIGAGPGATRFVLANPAKPADPTPLAFFTTQEHGAGRNNHIADVTFADFEIDGSGVELPAYDVIAKGLGLQYVVRGHFRNLYIHDTGATGFGCDFLQDTVVRDLIVVNCGRLDSGEDIGGAGIGIGIGGWGLDERLTVTGCAARGCGRNGIFVELQKDYWPAPRGIQITDCHVQDNRFGISDWGAEGLLVSGCTMVGNHHAGFDVSSQGTSRVAGRGGILSGCVIDANVRDGVSIGNTPGPYTVRGNRITNNGRHGYRQHNLEGGDDEPARAIVVEDNDVWGNGRDGIRFGAAVRDAFVVGNRVRGNGRRAAPGVSGGGPAVRYGALTLTDEGAAWPPAGHRGKTLRVGERTAKVVTNTATELLLAPWRPGAASAWVDGAKPADGTAYALPDPPPTRAGIAVAAVLECPTIRDNRVWDGEENATQTHGLWITADGCCRAGRVHDNVLDGHAVATARFETPPVGGRWVHNEGLPPTE